MALRGRKETGRHVGAVLAACDIMDSFLRCGSQTVKQVMDQTRLTRNRVMRVAGTLEARGYLHWDSRTGSYGLGTMAICLGKVYESQSNLCNMGQPILQELAHATGESSSINILDNMERVVLAREDGENNIRMVLSVGQRSPVHGEGGTIGAICKVLLAFGPKESREKSLNSIRLSRAASGAAANPYKLADELEQIKTQGYAYSLGERFPEAAGVFAPIFETGNQFLGALGISGPIYRFTPETLPDKIKRVMSAAAELSWHLGGLPSSSPDPSQRLKCYVETYAFKCSEESMEHSWRTRNG